ncbi:MAG: hypothetical protein ACTJLK_03380 [Anaplasma sp.]
MSTSDEILPQASEARTQSPSVDAQWQQLGMQESAPRGGMVNVDVGEDLSESIEGGAMGERKTHNKQPGQGRIGGAERGGSSSYRVNGAVAGQAQGSADSAAPDGAQQNEASHAASVRENQGGSFQSPSRQGNSSLRNNGPRGSASSMGGQSSQEAGSSDGQSQESRVSTTDPSGPLSARVGSRYYLARPGYSAIDEQIRHAIKQTSEAREKLEAGNQLVQELKGEELKVSNVTAASFDTIKKKVAAGRQTALRHEVEKLFYLQSGQDFVENMIVLVADAVAGDAVKRTGKSIFLYSINCDADVDSFSSLSGEENCVLVSYDLVVGLKEGSDCEENFKRVLFKFEVGKDARQNFVVKNVLVSATAMTEGPAQRLNATSLLSYDGSTGRWTTGSKSATPVTEPGNYATDEQSYFVKSGMETWKIGQLRLFQYDGDFATIEQNSPSWKVLEEGMKNLPPPYVGPVLRCISKDEFQKLCEGFSVEDARKALKFDHEGVKLLATAAVKSGEEGKRVSMTAPQRGWRSDIKESLVKRKEDGSEEQVGKESRACFYVFEVENAISQKVEAIVKYQEKDKKDRDWKEAQLIVRIVPGVSIPGVLPADYEVPRSLVMTCGADDISKSLNDIVKRSEEDNLIPSLFPSDLQGSAMGVQLLDRLEKTSEGHIKNYVPRWNGICEEVIDPDYSLDEESVEAASSGTSRNGGEVPDTQREKQPWRKAVEEEEAVEQRRIAEQEQQTSQYSSLWGSDGKLVNEQKIEEFFASGGGKAVFGELDESRGVGPQLILGMANALVQQLDSNADVKIFGDIKEEAKLLSDNAYEVSKEATVEVDGHGQFEVSVKYNVAKMTQRGSEQHAIKNVELSITPLGCSACSTKLPAGSEINGNYSHVWNDVLPRASDTQIRDMILAIRDGYVRAHKAGGYSCDGKAVEKLVARYKGRLSVEQTSSAPKEVYDAVLASGKPVRSESAEIEQMMLQHESVTRGGGVSWQDDDSSLAVGPAYWWDSSPSDEDGDRDVPQLPAKRAKSSPSVLPDHVGLLESEFSCLAQESVLSDFMQSCVTNRRSSRMAVDSYDRVCSDFIKYISPANAKPTATFPRLHVLKLLRSMTDVKRGKAATDDVLLCAVVGTCEWDPSVLERQLPSGDRLNLKIHAQGLRLNPSADKHGNVSSLLRERHFLLEPVVAEQKVTSRVHVVVTSNLELESNGLGEVTVKVKDSKACIARVASGLEMKNCIDNWARQQGYGYTQVAYMPRSKPSGRDQPVEEVWKPQGLVIGSGADTVIEPSRGQDEVRGLVETGLHMFVGAKGIGALLGVPSTVHTYSSRNIGDYISARGGNLLPIKEGLKRLSEHLLPELRGNQKSALVDFLELFLSMKRCGVTRRSIAYQPVPYGNASGRAEMVAGVRVETVYTLYMVGQNQGQQKDPDGLQVNLRIIYDLLEGKDDRGREEHGICNVQMGVQCKWVPDVLKESKGQTYSTPCAESIKMWSCPAIRCGINYGKSGVAFETQPAESLHAKELELSPGADVPQSVFADILQTGQRAAQAAEYGPVERFQPKTKAPVRAQQASAATDGRWDGNAKMPDYALGRVISLRIKNLREELGGIGLGGGDMSVDLAVKELSGKYTFADMENKEVSDHIDEVVIRTCGAKGAAKKQQPSKDAQTPVQATAPAVQKVPDEGLPPTLELLADSLEKKHGITPVATAVEKRLVSIEPTYDPTHFMRIHRDVLLDSLETLVAQAWSLKAVTDDEEATHPKLHGRAEVWRKGSGIGETLKVDEQEVHCLFDIEDNDQDKVHVLVRVRRTTVADENLYDVAWLGSRIVDSSFDMQKCVDDYKSRGNTSKKDGFLLCYEEAPGVRSRSPLRMRSAHLDEQLNVRTSLSSGKFSFNTEGTPQTKATNEQIRLMVQEVSEDYLQLYPSEQFRIDAATENRLVSEFSGQLTIGQLTKDSVPDYVRDRILEEGRIPATDRQIERMILRVYEELKERVALALDGWRLESSDIYGLILRYRGELKADETVAGAVPDAIKREVSSICSRNLQEQQKMWEEESARRAQQLAKTARSPATDKQIREMVLRVYAQLEQSLSTVKWVLSNADVDKIVAECSGKLTVGQMDPDSVPSTILDKVVAACSQNVAEAGKAAAPRAVEKTGALQNLATNEQILGMIRDLSSAYRPRHHEFSLDERARYLLLTRYAGKLTVDQVVSGSIPQHVRDGVLSMGLDKLFTEEDVESMLEIFTENYRTQHPDMPPLDAEVRGKIVAEFKGKTVDQVDPKFIREKVLSLLQKQKKDVTAPDAVSSSREESGYEPVVQMFYGERQKRSVPEEAFDVGSRTEGRLATDRVASVPSDAVGNNGPTTSDDVLRPKPEHGVISEGRIKREIWCIFENLRNCVELQGWRLDDSTVESMVIKLKKNGLKGNEVNVRQAVANLLTKTIVQKGLLSQEEAGAITTQILQFEQGAESVDAQQDAQSYGAQDLATDEQIRKMIRDVSERHKRNSPHEIFDINDTLEDQLVALYRGDLTTGQVREVPYDVRLDIVTVGRRGALEAGKRPKQFSSEKLHNRSLTSKAFLGTDGVTTLDAGAVDKGVLGSEDKSRGRGARIDASAQTQGGLENLKSVVKLGRGVGSGDIVEGDCLVQVVERLADELELELGNSGGGLSQQDRQDMVSALEGKLYVSDFKPGNKHPEQRAFNTVVNNVRPFAEKLVVDEEGPDRIKKAAVVAIMHSTCTLYDVIAKAGVAADAPSKSPEKAREELISMLITEVNFYFPEVNRQHDWQLFLDPNKVNKIAAEMAEEFPTVTDVRLNSAKVEERAKQLIARDLGPSAAPLRPAAAPPASKVELHPTWWTPDRKLRAAPQLSEFLKGKWGLQLFPRGVLPHSLGLHHILTVARVVVNASAAPSGTPISVIGGVVSTNVVHALPRNYAVCRSANVEVIGHGQFRVAVEYNVRLEEGVVNPRCIVSDMVLSVSNVEDVQRTSTTFRSAVSYYHSAGAKAPAWVGAEDDFKRQKKAPREENAPRVAAKRAGVSRITREQAIIHKKVTKPRGEGPVQQESLVDWALGLFRKIVIAPLFAFMFSMIKRTRSALGWGRDQEALERGGEGSQVVRQQQSQRQKQPQQAAQPPVAGDGRPAHRLKNPVVINAALTPGVWSGTTQPR